MQDTHCQTSREVAFRTVHQIASSHHSPGSSEIFHLPRNRVSSCHLSQQSQFPTHVNFLWVNDLFILCRNANPLGISDTSIMLHTPSSLSSLLLDLQTLPITHQTSAVLRAYYFSRSDSLWTIVTTQDRDLCVWVVWC